MIVHRNIGVIDIAEWHCVMHMKIQSLVSLARSARRNVCEFGVLIHHVFLDGEELIFWMLGQFLYLTKRNQGICGTYQIFLAEYR